jgi:hypothetical protein
MEEVKEFSEMTNAELQTFCDAFDLKVTAKAANGKPNKAELLATIEKFKAKQEEINAPRIAEKAEAAEAAPVTDGSKRRPQSKSELMKLDLFRKDRVIIHDQQDKQTKDELISVSWGNRMVGGQTDWVDVASGNPQYVRRGALRNLRDATTVIQVPKGANGSEAVIKPRFIIVDVKDLTPEEFEELKNVQKMRNSKRMG